jgi:hypothetical protein
MVASPDLNPNFTFKSSLNADLRFQIRFKSGFRISNPNFKPDFRLTSGIGLSEFESIFDLIYT